MMENLKILVDQLRAQKTENEWLEFKINKYEPHLIGEYISALSNSASILDKPKAYIVFGIEDKSHNVVGTKFHPREVKVNNAQELENWLATHLRPRINFSFFELEYKEKHIVVLEIDSTKNQPVSFHGEEYIRIGGIKKKLKDHPGKERLLWKKLENTSFENDIALSSLTANDVLRLLDYPPYFTLLNLNLPDNKNGILSRFEEEEFIIRNGSKYDITNYGAILFAKDLEDFPDLKRKAIRVIIYKGKNKLETIKEKGGRRGYAVGFLRLIDYITSILPSNEVIEKAFRREIKMYPEIVIRELIANAIIHQDFSIKGTSPMIEIYSNRIEITNSGKPLIDTNRFIDHNPVSRNEKIASFMRRINICEERGSGIDKVINAVEVFQLPAPDFKDYEDFIRVTLYAHKELREMDKQGRIRACYQHCCLRYVMAEFMSNSSFRERMGINEKNYPIISRIIKESIDADLIKYADPENKSPRLHKYIPYWG